MIGPTDFQAMLSANPSIDGIIRLSRDGLALNSHLRIDRQIDEVVSIGAGLFSAALELGLVREKDNPSLFIGAEHGSLYLRAEKEQTLLLILTKDQCTESQVEAMIAEYDIE